MSPEPGRAEPGKKMARGPASLQLLIRLAVLWAGFHGETKSSQAQLGVQETPLLLADAAECSVGSRADQPANYGVESREVATISYTDGCRCSQVYPLVYKEV